MAAIDRDAPRLFLSRAFEPDDWIAVLVKWHDTGRVIQRVGAAAWVASSRVQAWVRAQNAAHASVFVLVNALVPGQRSRRREAIRDVRHVFLDVDDDLARVQEALNQRPDIPTPSCVVHSSPGRAHLLWRVRGFTGDTVEPLQKHLAAVLHTDVAATSAAQLTRLPGLRNYKYTPPPLVTLGWQRTEVRHPTDFPMPARMPTLARRLPRARPTGSSCLRRAREYVAFVPPAVAGQRGDAQTFRLCCRLARGFALSDDEVLEVLESWNARCQPPWSEGDLARKVRHARRYGREPVGGLLETPP